MDKKPTVVYFTDGASGPRNLVSDVLNEVDRYEALIFVGLEKDDSIMVGSAGGSNLERVALIAFAKDYYLGKCYGD